MNFEYETLRVNRKLNAEQLETLKEMTLMEISVLNNNPEITIEDIRSSLELVKRDLFTYISLDKKFFSFSETYSLFGQEFETQFYINFENQVFSYYEFYIELNKGSTEFFCKKFKLETLNNLKKNIRTRYHSSEKNYSIRCNVHVIEHENLSGIEITYFFDRKHNIISKVGDFYYKDAVVESRCLNIYDNSLIEEKFISFMIHTFHQNVNFEQRYFIYKDIPITSAEHTGIDVFERIFKDLMNSEKKDEFFDYLTLLDISII